MERTCVWAGAAKVFFGALLVWGAVVPGCSGGGGGGDTATAIVAPWSTNFDGSAPLEGWLFYDPYDGSPPAADVPTLWAVDATPSSVYGGSAYVSSPNSLNYNNGVDYDIGASSGAAITPKLDISGMTAPILTFLCNYDTETEGAGLYDQRHVKIGYLDSDGAPVYFYEEQLSTDPGSESAGACATWGTWHEHVIVLDPSWAEIRIAFLFDSYDGWDNAWAGWFIDNVHVIEAADYTPWVPGSEEPPPEDPPTEPPADPPTAPPSDPPSEPPAEPPADPPTAPPSDPPSEPPAEPPADPPTTPLPTPFTDSFDTTPTGWTLSGTASPTVAWAFDGTPSTVTGGAAYSGTTSLNYNNGTDYDSSPDPNSGSAISPPITISAATTPQLHFWCNYETETDLSYDQRWVRIRDNATDAVLWEGQLSEVGGAADIGACAAIGTWHSHTLALTPSWGTVKVEFYFTTVDAYTNTYAGWFVDDFSVTDAAAPPPSAPPTPPPTEPPTTKPPSTQPTATEPPPPSSGGSGHRRKTGRCSGSAPAVPGGTLPLAVALALVAAEWLRRSTSMSNKKM